MLHTMLTNTLAWGMPGGAEWILIALFGLLIFGKRLPEVGRSLGKGIVEFKKGLKGVESEIEDASSQPDRQQIPHQQQQTLPPAAGYKFDPYTGKPIEEAQQAPAGEPGKATP